MKNVRVWFKKDDACRFISHLDLNRCMLRALHKSRIPIWHTEGYNIHPYATFPLPLSLGFRGEKECMDIRLVEDYDFNNIKENLNNCLPDGIRVYNVTEPIMKAKEITYASFKIRITSDDVDPDKLFEICSQLLGKEQILIEKRTKKKGIKEIDIKPYIMNQKLERNIGGVILSLTLPAGSVTNINPTLIQKAIERYYGIEVYFDVTKKDMFDKNLNIFR